MTTIVAAVAAAVLAGTFALIGAQVGYKRDQKTWLRDQRLAAGMAVLAQIDTILGYVVSTKHPPQGTAEAMKRRTEELEEWKRTILEFPKSGASVRYQLVAAPGHEESLRSLREATRALLKANRRPEGTDAEHEELRKARQAFIKHVRSSLLS